VGDTHVGAGRNIGRRRVFAGPVAAVLDLAVVPVAVGTLQATPLAAVDGLLELVGSHVVGFF
jgi:hypothetical protein